MTATATRSLWWSIARNDRTALRAHPAHRRVVLTVTLLGVAAGSFSNSLLVAALPQVARDLGTTTSVVSWVNIAPTIAFAVSMPIFGKLGDLYGHRRVFLCGWSVATLLAFATAFAPDAYWLIGLRTAAQLAGTSTTPTTFGILASVFEPDERPRAFGKALSVHALSPLVAITVGGAAIDAVGWRALFVAQAVVAAVAVLVAIPVLPETPTRRDIRFDVRGAALLSVGMVSLLLAINRSPEWGLDHGFVRTAFVVALAGLVAFVVVERRVRAPLVPLTWLGRREVAAPLVTNFCAHAAFLGLVMVTPFLLREVFGYSDAMTVWITGLRTGSFAVGAFTVARVTARLGPRRVQFLMNTFVMLSGLLTFVAAHEHSVGVLVVSFLIGGYGLGAGRPSVIAAVNNAVSNADSGTANGLYSMAQMLGSSIGQTVLVAIVGTATMSAAAYGHAGLAAGVIGAATVLAGSFIRFDEGGRT
jgi:MFS family permease